MTDLEYYKDEIEKNFKTYDAFWGEMTLAVSLQGFLHNHIKECGEDAKSQLYWLLDEHVTPIRLKQWEKDLLKCYQETKDDGEFVEHYILKEMQYKGHFQDVDYNLTIEEILDNCEVIEE